MTSNAVIAELEQVLREKAKRRNALWEQCSRLDDEMRCLENTLTILRNSVPLPGAGGPTATTEAPNMPKSEQAEAVEDTEPEIATPTGGRRHADILREMALSNGGVIQIKDAAKYFRDHNLTKNPANAPSVVRMAIKQSRWFVKTGVGTYKLIQQAEAAS